ncbi:phosphomannomutase/phosphoglucomutase [bacterium]|nr:phosphomannomutase/phosphoglucomutase [bacterium]
MNKTISFTAFGKNDLRGIYGEDITEDLYYYVGQAFISYIRLNTSKRADEIWVTVSQDARLHSQSLAKSLMKGIVSTGANVVNLGLVPTPLGYYSEMVGVPDKITNDNPILGSLIVTASHNPSEYNGLKLTFNKMSFTEEQIKELKEITQKIITGEEPQRRWGMNKDYDIIPQYSDNLVKSFARVGAGVKVVVDSANGTGGVVAPQLYRDLGCDVIELYSEPDGNFPNHHPNPSNLKTLDAIRKSVVENNADIGIAFDGDSDRIGVIDSQGNPMSGDKLLLIYGLDVIQDLVRRGEKPKIVSEVKCSQVLYDTINKNGGEAIMCKTGHGFIKAKMKETGAILAGEMSGHIFFKDRYYGFDDAIYAGCRIIEIVAKNKFSNPNFKIENLLSDFDGIYSSDEVRFHCPNDRKKEVLDKLKNVIDENKDIFGSPIRDIITIDGMRIIFDDGFALIRQSNTEPVFTMRFEAKSKEKMEHYQEVLVGETDKLVNS